MTFQKFSYALVTIAAIAGTQVVASAQERFKTPTHPTLSEITTDDQRPMTDYSSMSPYQVNTSPQSNQMGSESYPSSGQPVSPRASDTSNPSDRLKTPTRPTLPEIDNSSNNSNNSNGKPMMSPQTGGNSDSVEPAKMPRQRNSSGMSTSPNSNLPMTSPQNTGTGASGNSDSVEPAKMPNQRNSSGMSTSPNNNLPMTSPQNTGTSGNSDSVEPAKAPKPQNRSDANLSPNSVMPMMAPQSSNPMTQSMTFSRAPRLGRVNASHKGTFVPSTYEFTITVPSDAGAPLQAVRIAQDENLETVEFDVSESKAFKGEGYKAGSELRLASVGGAQSTPGEAIIVFDQPVAPGDTVTIGLDVPGNPMSDGVYEFGVTAYSDRTQNIGQFLGYGRITLYGGGN